MDQGHDTSFGHGQQLCKNLLRYNKGLEVMAPITYEQGDSYMPPYFVAGYKTTNLLK